MSTWLQQLPNLTNKYPGHLASSTLLTIQNVPRGFPPVPDAFDLTFRVTTTPNCTRAYQRHDGKPESPGRGAA